MSTMAAVAVLLTSGSAAWADTARFVPDATDVKWDGAEATVVFQEEGVEVEGDVTTISVKVTADVDIVCTRGESTVNVHRTATALETHEYRVKADGTVAATAKLPLKVAKVTVPPGWSCVTDRRSVTTVLEDFYTGATLEHKT